MVLGLPGVVVKSMTETFERVQFFLDATAPLPPCPKCLHANRLVPHGFFVAKVRDTPMRGKPSTLFIRRQRARCSCGATCSQALPAIVETDFPKMTIRLARYIENESFRRPMAHVAAEVSAPESAVRKLVLRLADRLFDYHRFPTPIVLGIDDLRMRRKLYTVFTDGQTGHAIGLVEGGKELDIRRQMHNRGIDPTKVKVVVSDLGSSNIAVVKNLFGKLPVVHVADKWHVLKGAQEALTLVVNKEIDRLRRRRARWERVLGQHGRVVPKSHAAHPLNKMQVRISTLRDAKKHLSGARLRLSDTAQLTLDVNTMVIAPMLARYPNIGKAFWAKMRLHMVYMCTSRAAADVQIDRFIKRASSPSIREQMKVIVARVETHRSLILNYHNAFVPHPSGIMAAPTSGPTERRNGSIKSAWRSGRGITNLKLLTMRALYEPWQINVDILVCGEAGCHVVDGPLKLPRHVRQQSFVPPAYVYRCAQCS